MTNGFKRFCLTLSYSWISFSSSSNISVSPVLASIFLRRIWLFLTKFYCELAPPPLSSLSEILCPRCSETMHREHTFSWSFSQKYFVFFCGCFRQNFSEKFSSWVIEDSTWSLCWYR